MPRSWIVACVVLSIIYLATSGIPTLFDQIDGQYAGAAREMIDRGDWLVPTQNGVPRLQKPPLVYWCEIVSLSLFGKNEFAARLPVALVTIAWCVATGLIARRVIGTAASGVAAAITLAAFAGTFFFCHLVMPEPFIGCFVALSFWAILQALEERSISRQDRWLLIAWIFIALGTLSKGLHAVLFPVVAISLTAGLKPSLRAVWRRFLLRPQGWILFLAITVPWYAAVERRYPGFLLDHILNEQLGPALSQRWPPDSDRVPWLIFWLQHLVLFFPTTLLFPALARSALRQRKSGAGAWSVEAFLLLGWFLANAVGISFANIQDYYLMVAWPPVAVGIAWTISRNETRLKWPALVLAALGSLGLLGSFAFTLWLRASVDELSPGLGSQPVNQDTIMIGLRHLPASAWANILPLLYVMSGAMLITGALVYLFDRHGKPDSGFAGFALLMAVIFLCGTRGLAIVQDNFSSTNVARSITRLAKPDSVVIQQGSPNEKTSLFFYLPRAIYWVDGRPDLEFATRSLRIGRDYYLERSAVSKKWRGAQQIFLIVHTGELDKWKTFLQDNPPMVVAAFGPQTVLLNR